MKHVAQKLQMCDLSAVFLLDLRRDGSRSARNREPSPSQTGSHDPLAQAFAGTAMANARQRLGRAMTAGHCHPVHGGVMRWMVDAAVSGHSKDCSRVSVPFVHKVELQNG